MSPSIKFLDLQSQYLLIKHEIDSAIQDVLNTGQFINSHHVSTFEEQFAAYVGSKYCVGVGNGTDALEIAIEALGMPPRSEIIVPANSFIASSEAITRTGHKVVFCDINPSNYTLSITDLEKRITDKTKAVIAVHLYGHPCDMDQILSVASQHGLYVIEDCAQAHGAVYRSHKVGTFGIFSTFSFYPGKNLGAYGDAGAILTNDHFLHDQARMIANHGRKEKYTHLFEGRNSRLDSIQASILSVKLKYLESWISIRNKCASTYVSCLDHLEDRLSLPGLDFVDSRHAYHLFVIRTIHRDALRSYLSSKAVQSGIHYPIALSRLPAYEYLESRDLPVSTSFDSQVLSLPIGEHLDTEQIEYISSLIADFFDEYPNS